MLALREAIVVMSLKLFVVGKVSVKHDHGHHEPRAQRLLEGYSVESYEKIKQVVEASGWRYHPIDSSHA
jgi:hypothetical protein